MSLVDGVRHHLPGIALATDEAFVADRVRQMLLDGRATVDAVSVGKVWLRSNGTCALRYRLRLCDGSADLGEHSVLGVVHHDDEAAAAYITNDVGRMTEARNGAPRPPPWRALTAVAAGAGLALHPFPIDPALPSLTPAMNPMVVSRLLTFSRPVEPPTVEVVHHPREGACVLRYRFPSGRDGPSNAPVLLYGKVYGSDRGEIVAGFMHALARGQLDHADPCPARFPKPLAYSPSLRLLVTDALPGEPLVTRLLKSVLAPVPGSCVEEDAVALRAAVRTSGQAVAALHRGHVATAPVHSASEDLTGLRREIELVARVWPDVAEELRRRIDLLSEDVPDVTGLLLSHGDFTPSQVLLGAGTPGVVDLDTLCWADPALDLGRYLAHLDLLAVRLAGEAAGFLVHDLTCAFLEGYGEATTRADGAADRIAFYKAMTVVRSALHACRQLKDHRLEAAQLLLDSVYDRT